MRKGSLRLMIGARLQSFGTVSNRPSSLMYYVLRHSNILAADTPYLKAILVCGSDISLAFQLSYNLESNHGFNKQP